MGWVDVPASAKKFLAVDLKIARQKLKRSLDTLGKSSIEWSNLRKYLFWLANDDIDKIIKVIATLAKQNFLIK